MSLLRIRCCAVTLIAGFLVCSHAHRVHADEKGVTVHRSHNSDAAQRILRALQQPTVIEFTETPLQDVVLYLKDYHKIEIQLDTKALDDVGLAPDTPVTRNLQGITLESALRLLLKAYDLTYIVDNEVLTITTVAVDNARREIRIYNIAGLIQGGTAEELAQVVLQTITSPRPPEGDPVTFTVIPYRRLLIVRHSQQGHREVEAFLEQLHRAVQAGR